MIEIGFADKLLVYNFAINVDLCEPTAMRAVYKGCLGKVPKAAIPICLLWL
jgi:hypothetical protein